jgi:hypothetical protein
MVLVEGIDVSRHDAVNLAATLMAEGTPDAVSASELIERAVRLQFARVVFTPAQRAAVLSVLEDPPEGLTELSGLLAWAYSDQPLSPADSPSELSESPAAPSEPAATSDGGQVPAPRNEELETHAVCAYCGRRVDPNQPGVTYAVEQVATSTAGDHGVADGLGSYFHPGCSMAAAGYQERPRPA